MVGFLMGIWLLSSSLAHQGGKHIAKLTTVNEKTIVESESFKNAEMDKDIRALILTDKFKKELEGGSVEDVLTDSTFIAELNTKSDKVYAKSTIYIKEALDEANKYSGAAKKKMLKAAKIDFISLKKYVILSDTVSEKNLAEILKNTPGTAVINSIRNESLKKGLSVFEMLGFIAIACGLLLFAIGKPIKKWMHGIN
jgi:POT family proton-dependent oligopeptide transporter